MKRILAVDNAASIRLFYRSILEAADYSVEEAVNGVEALEKAQEEPFDLYLVDVKMPKLDGYGFLRELRKENISQAPAIMTSTEATPIDAEQAYLAGANDYLVKPVTPKQLLWHIRLLLGEAQT